MRKRKGVREPGDGGVVEAVFLRPIRKKAGTGCGGPRDSVARQVGRLLLDAAEEPGSRSDQVHDHFGGPYGHANNHSEAALVRCQWTRTTCHRTSSWRRLWQPAITHLHTYKKETGAPAIGATSERCVTIGNTAKESADSPWRSSGGRSIVQVGQGHDSSCGQVLMPGTKPPCRHIINSYRCCAVVDPCDSSRIDRNWQVWRKVGRDETKINADRAPYMAGTTLDCR